MKAILAQLILSIAGLAMAFQGERVIGSVFIVGALVIMALRSETKK